MVASGNSRPGCHWNSFARSKKRVFSLVTGSSSAAVLKLNGPKPTPTASRMQLVSEVNEISSCLRFQNVGGLNKELWQVLMTGETQLFADAGMAVTAVVHDL